MAAIEATAAARRCWTLDPELVRPTNTPYRATRTDARLAANVDDA
jgi:hypothetical protein